MSPDAMKLGQARHAARSVFGRLGPRDRIAAALTITVIGCAGASGRSGDQPKTSTEAAQPPKPTPSDPGAGAQSAQDSSAGSVGAKLVRDVDASPKQFTIGPSNGHGLGDFSLAVDGSPVWPPKGKGCSELVRCCTDLVALKKELAMACLLATGRDGDCSTALRTSSDIAIERGFALPSSCTH
jgi:hypothetical protein